MRTRKVASKARIWPVTVTGLVIVVPAAGESTLTVSGVPGFGFVAQTFAAAAVVAAAGGEAVAVAVSAAGVLVSAVGVAVDVVRVVLGLGEGLAVSSLLEQAATSARVKQGIAMSESIFMALMTTRERPGCYGLACVSTQMLWPSVDTVTSPFSSVRKTDAPCSRVTTSGAGWPNGLPAPTE